MTHASRAGCRVDGSGSGLHRNNLKRGEVRPRRRCASSSGGHAGGEAVAASAAIVAAALFEPLESRRLLSAGALDGGYGTGGVGRVDFPSSASDTFSDEIVAPGGNL